MKIDFTTALKISEGHIVKDFTTMQAYCGFNGFGWDFGSISQATCPHCIEIYSIFT